MKEERERVEEPVRKPPVPPKQSTADTKARVGSSTEISRGKERDRVREIEEAAQQSRSRASSTSSQHSQPERNVTKEVGITVYTRKSSIFFFFMKRNTEQAQCALSLVCIPQEKEKKGSKKNKTSLQNI